VEETLSVKVDAKGEIFLPVIGKLTLAGLNFDQSRALIVNAFRKYYRNVEVNVTLQELRTLRVFVAGDARAPGAYTVNALATAFNVLYLAGGPNGQGSMRGIRLTRDGRDVGTIDLYRYLLTGDRTQDYGLQQGDTLFVPVIGPTVAVYGDVKRPALYELVGSERLRDALELAGGARSTAYLARIQLDRIVNSKRRTVLDINLTEALEKDSEPTNPLLQDGDAIGIFPVSEMRTGVVRIDGPVQNPGVYELREGMRVSDLIKEARGLRSDVEVYLSRGDVIRALPDTRLKMLPFNLQDALSGGNQDLLLKEQDKVVIYSQEHVAYQGYVEVQGNVERPGLYQRPTGMRISDLLFQAGLTKKDAYRRRANLVRSQPDGNQEVLAVNLDSIDAGVPSSDLELQDMDTLKVFTVEEADSTFRHRWVKIEGAVQRPGSYERQSNMTLQDLIFVAGGLLPSAADEAEIARMGSAGDTVVLTSNLVSLYHQDDERQNVLLQNRDYVLVKLREAFREWTPTATTLGQFNNPGEYAIREGKDTLLSLIKRAGGLTPEAFPEGAVFTRAVAKLVVPDQKNQADKVKDEMDQTARSLSSAWALGSKGAVIEAGKGTQVSGTQPVTAATVDGEALVGAREIGEIVPTRRIAIDLRGITEGSSPDIVLEEGDYLHVPRRPTTIFTAGAVINPGPILFAGKENVKNCVKRSGGYTLDAAPPRSVIVRANGLVESAKQSSWMQLGDILVVPTKPMIYEKPKSWLESFGEIAQLAASSATTVYLLSQIGK